MGVDLSQLSDAELLNLEKQASPAEPPGLLSQAYEGYVKPTLKALDSVTGAPVRSALGRMQGERDASIPRQLIDAGKSYVHQFGADPDSAPSGKQLAANAGFDDKRSMSDRFPGAFTDEKGFTLKAKKGGLLDVTPAGVAGFGTDIVTDPLMHALPLLKTTRGLIAEENAARAAGGGAAAGGGGGSANAGAIAKDASAIFADRPYRRNAEEIRQAVKEFTGKDAPDYLLRDDRPTEHLTDTLLKSPTIGGKATRAEVQPIYSALDDYAQGIKNNAQNGLLSDYETGSAVREGISKKFQEMTKPAEAIYGDIESKFKDVGIRKVSIKSAITRLRNEYLPSDIGGEAEKTLNNLERKLIGTPESPGIQSVEQLRDFRTKLGMLASNEQSTVGKNILNEFYGVLTRERDRSILKNAIQSGAKIGRQARAQQLLGQLQEADGIYRDAMTKASGSLNVEGTKSMANSSAIRQYLKETPAEQLAQQLFNKRDVGRLNQLKQNFPEQFELLRKKNLADIVEKSSTNGAVEPSRLVRNLMNQEPEVQKMLLGDEMAKKLQLAQQNLQALPKDFNPSHTAHALLYQKLGLKEWFTKNLGSLVQRQLLKKGQPDVLGAVKRGLLE